MTWLALQRNLGCRLRSAAYGAAVLFCSHLAAPPIRLLASADPSASSPAPPPTAIEPANSSRLFQELPRIPDRLGLAGAFAGTSGDSLLVAGGANFPNGFPWEGGKKAWHGEVYLLDKPDGQWKTAGRLPRPLAYGVSFATADGLILAGGSDADRHHATVFRLSLADGKLVRRDLPPLPTSLAMAAGAAVGSVLYLAGGAEAPGEQSASNRLFALDLASRDPAWKELEPLPASGRILSTAAAVSDEFLLLGGASLPANDAGKVVRKYLREAWSYRPNRGWKRLADLPSPLAAAATPAPVVGNEVYLISGDDGSRAGFSPPEKHPGFTDAVHVYDAKADAWRTAGKSPAPRVTLSTAPWQDGFALPSGEVRPGVRSPEVWLFRPPPPAERRP